MLKQFVKIALICLLLTPMASCTSCGGGSGGGGDAVTYTYYGAGQIGSTVLTLEQSSLGSDGSFVYKDIISSSEATGTYSSVGTLYTFLIESGSTTGWFHAGDSGVILIPTSGEDTLSAGIVITPATTTLDFMTGNTYGGITFSNGATGVQYMRWYDITALNIKLCLASAITDPCTLYGDFPKTALPYNATDHYFKSEDAGTTTYAYVNETLGYLLEFDYLGPGAGGFTIFSEDPATTTVPAGIAVNNVFNGYVFSKTPTVDAEINARAATVTAVSASSITLSLDGGIGSITATPDVSGNWPGFWVVSGTNIVIRFIGDNTIAISSKTADSNYYWGLLVK